MKKKLIAAVCGACVLGAGAWIFLPSKGFLGSAEVLEAVSGLIEPEMPPLPQITETRAVYITASMARSARMDDIVAMVKTTEGERGVNALVIDIQDDNGKVLIDNRLKELLRRLRFLQIFPIARLVAFQNNSIAEEHPEWAVKKSDGSLWQDKGGRKWLDPSNKAVWEYVASLAWQAGEAGFGEINFDYFRFPSEGVTTAVYPVWREGEGREKTDVIVEAAQFLRDKIKTHNAEIKVTVDIFGYTFMRKYDLGIGQSAPRLAAVLDAVCPMIYPSHYNPGNFNFENPAAHPYEVMKQTLEKGKAIFAEVNQPFTNIRPWIQDFDLGAVYTVPMVQEQMQAIKEMGLSEGWLIWNPRNKYRPEILNKT